MLSQINRKLPVMHRIFTFLTLAFVISACGWQLRGYEPEKSGLTFTRFSELRVLSDDRYNAFYSALKTALTRNNIRENAQSDIVLQLSPEVFDRKPLAYGSTGVPAQYELTLSVEFQISRAGELLVPQRRLISRRNYDFDPDLVIEKDREQEELLQEMRSEMADRIIDAIAQSI